MEAQFGPSKTELLLAEELCVLRMGPRLDRRIPGCVDTGIVGALVSQLIVAGRASVKSQPQHREKSITVVDAVATGDDLLDETLSLLADEPATAGGAPADKRSLMARISGRRVRRRLHDNGEATAKDLPYWWFGSWRCAEFPNLAPTLVVQLLLLQESLDRPLQRVIDHLKARGALTSNNATSSLDPVVYLDVRNRVREAVFAEHRTIEPRVAHLIALRGVDEDWTKHDIDGPRAERRRARSQADTLLEDLPVAKGVRTITDAYWRMTDWYIG